MKRFPLIYSIFCVVFISGCASFKDVSYDRQANQQLQKIAGSSITVDAEPDRLALTQLMAIKELDVLISIALANNTGLKQTLLTLKTAGQQLTATSSARWPNLSIGVTRDRRESSPQSFTSKVDVAWTVDIWQKLANSSNAQESSYTANAYAYQAAKDLLVANIMQAYIGLIQFAQLIDIESRRVKGLTTNEQIIIARYRKGLIKLNELDTAKSSTQSSAATLVDYQAQYQQALRNLSLLTGVNRNQLEYRTAFPKVMMPLHQVDSKNLGRRPDLQQAYHNIITQQFQHKVAYKSLLPSLSLSGSLTNNNANLHDALFASSAWQLLGQLSVPIFNASRLTSEVEIAKLAAEKSYWVFQEKLLLAVNEVDNAIAQERTITERLKLIQSALSNAKRSEATYSLRYRQGTVSLLDLLQVQQQTFSLQTQVTRLNYERLSNRVSLGLALGLGV